MQPKSYQIDALRDLERFLQLTREDGNYATAFRSLWEEKGVRVPDYRDLLAGVPNVCFKVPTGGGKTFLAACALPLIFAALPPERLRSVVWLCPSDTILEQTLRNLRNPDHPYRTRLAADFGGRVEVYSKQELLNGQNFSAAALREQLSVFVLSYDSFRARNKEGRKAYQENSALDALSRELPASDAPIEGADETALFSIINRLNPVVIVDESHHARSELSLEMLRGFNPAFVLDLTATPRKESNVVSCVSAYSLKREHMVKLPVIVYNRRTQADVMADAVDLRNALENRSVKEAGPGGSGAYIRPIALFQAEPKDKDDAQTFENVRDALIAMGVPREQIAVKTAAVNELKDVDLLSPSCPVRYIVTVNALKEGWDCPFAYVLAALANRSSAVDVEQILGRILRQPHAHACRDKALNMSYVLTSSADFDAALQKIVAALNSAGFSEADCRRAGPVEPENAPASWRVSQPKKPPTLPLPLQDSDDTTVPQPDEQPSTSPAETPAAPVSTGVENTATDSGNAAGMLEAAGQAGDDYEERAATAGESGRVSVPEGATDMNKTYAMIEKFADEALSLAIPQFFVKSEPSIFGDGEVRLLDRGELCSSFTLAGKPCNLDFAALDEQMTRVDVTDAGGVPKAFSMSAEDQKDFRRLLSGKTPESRRRICRDLILQAVDRIDEVETAELKRYVDRVIGELSREQLEQMERSPQRFALLITDNVRNLIKAHCRDEFFRRVDTLEIVCRPSYRLPKQITLPEPDAEKLFGQSLYAAEGRTNGLEKDLIKTLTAAPNVKWWHRNIERKDFCINGGFLNHYPDLMLLTEKGTIVLVETKGAFLKNDDSRDKLKLGRRWADKATLSAATEDGRRYQYFMVFANDVEPIKDAHTMAEFAQILSKL